MTKVWLQALVVVEVARDDGVEMTGPGLSGGSKRAAKTQATHQSMNTVPRYDKRGWIGAEQGRRHVRDEEARADLPLLEVPQAREVQVEAVEVQQAGVIAMAMETLHRMVAGPVADEARVAVVDVLLSMAVELHAVVAHLEEEEHHMGEEECWAEEEELRKEVR